MQEEKKDELKPKAMASISAALPPQNPNPNIKPIPNPNPNPKVREEGELTSSDDDVDAPPAASVAVSTSTLARPSSSVQYTSVKSNVQGVSSGKSVSANLPARTSEIQSQTAGYHKGFSKNQVLLKPSNPGWCVPGVDNNLVISFSDDDDSGSDGEERRKKKGKKTDGDLHTVKSNRKPPAMPNVKLDHAGRTAKKLAPKNVSVSRTFASSVAKTYDSGVRSGGASAEQRLCLKVSNVAGKISSIQDRGSKSVDLRSSKLQELRQQIAMRENELKRKIVLKNKENISDACRDVNVMVQNKMPSEKRSAHPSDLHTELGVPDRKRLKNAQYGSEQPSSSGRHAKVAEPISVLNEPLRGHLVDHANRDTDNLGSQLMPLSDGRQFPPTSQHHPAPAVAVSCSLSDWISRPNEDLTMPRQSALLTNSTISDSLDKSNPGAVYKKQPLSSAANKDMRGNKMINVNDLCGSMSAREKLKSASDSSLQACTLQVSDNKFESPHASPENTSLLRSLGRSTLSGNSDVDVNSLFEIEELHDKELEEAQEHRRRCEIEEINALKAYRRAQRALAEANAQCTYLFRKREMYSAQLRSLVMEDSSLLWSSSQHRQIGDPWNTSNNASEVNLELIPSSSHQLQVEVEARNQLGYYSNVQSADGDAHYRSSGNEDGHNLDSEVCSEPDASTSQLNNSDANGVHSRCINQNISPDDDDDETFPLDHETGPANAMSSQGEDTTKEGEMNMDIDSSTSFLTDGSRDPLLLEAYLRSKLFSRLGVISSSKQGGTCCESAVGKASEEEVAGPKTEVAMKSISCSDHEVLNADCLDCPKEPESGISTTPLDSKTLRHVEEHFLNNSAVPTLDPEDGSFRFIDMASSPIIQSSSIFRSAIKAAGTVSLDSAQVREQHHGSPDMCSDDDSLVQCDQDKLSVVSSAQEVASCVNFDKIDSYTCKSAIDPFWPLCMYELRGRCNDDECPWQHVKDYSRNVIQNNSSDIADRQTESSSACAKQRHCAELSNVLVPPRYLVCLDSLKAESYGSLQARQLASSLKNVLSNSLAVSSSLLKHLPSDEPYLHGNDGCIESCSGSGHSLYFRQRNGTGNPLQNGSANNDQCLEMALLVLNQEIDKVDGMKKALLILSRALEADPTSLHLWIVYLLLYHSTKNSDSELDKNWTVGEDEIFSCAVKHHEQSYELWLLYINSHRKLNDRLAAFERAISHLCHHASRNDGHMMHHSSAILDLFLQMLHCFCMSGNVTKALPRIYGLILTDRDCDESHSLLLSDILQCLTISDKCIFWVCCVYLVIYRKLPDAMVQQFEFEKDISIMEWPSVHLTLEQKEQVSKLMEMAIDSVELHIDNKSHEDECSTVKSAHLIAVNHLKLMAAIDGEESYMTFLEKYKNSYPSCLELVLLSARAHCVGESANFEGFEAAISNWPEEVPGIQCIWNQFVEYVFEKGKPLQAKEILDKWFNSVWKHQFHHNRLIDAEHNDINSSSVDLSGPDFRALLSSSNKMDAVFALLNLSLYNVFHNRLFEAQLAIDKALKIADPEVFRHCVREHAVFLFNNSSQLRKDVSVHGLLDILKGYMHHTWAINARNPLTRLFIKDIQKPRLRQLVLNILNPISPDTCLVNSVLDVWIGSSFLSQKSIELKDLVDFAEAILEVSPANYQLMISICRLLCRGTVACNTKSARVLFWASSLLVNTLYHAVPVPPEYIWAEAADLLRKLTNVREISESFHQRALSIYPFSIKLWKSFLNLSMTTEKRSSVIEAAKNKGIHLD